jgi:hypothetical protein
VPELTIQTTQEGGDLNEVQLVGYMTAGQLEDGNFFLTYGQETTYGIEWDESAAGVKEALEDLQSIDVGDVSVSGGSRTGSCVKGGWLQRAGSGRDDRRAEQRVRPRAHLGCAKWEAAATGPDCHQECNLRLPIQRVSRSQSRFRYIFARSGSRSVGLRPRRTDSLRSLPTRLPGHHGRN